MAGNRSGTVRSAGITGHNAWWKTPYAVGADLSGIRAEVRGAKGAGRGHAATGRSRSPAAEQEFAGIVDAYEAAYAEKISGEAEVRRKAARAFAMEFDADLVLERHWKPVLAELESM